MSTQIGTYNPGSTYSPTANTTSQVANGGVAASTFWDGLTQSGFDDLFSARAALDNSNVNVLANAAPTSYSQALPIIYQMHPDELYTVQQQMYQAGLLTKAGDVSGIPNKSTYSAWQQVVTDAMRSNVPVFTLLNMGASSGSYATIADQLQKQASSLETQISAPKSVGVSLTDTNALYDTANAEWEDALGYAATDQEKAAFAAGFHSQENASGSAQLAADKSAFSIGLQRVQAEAGQLKALGPNGLDSFLTAYQHALATAGAAGTGIQGRQIATGASLPSVATDVGRTAGPEGPSTEQAGAPQGLLGAMASNLNPARLLHPTEQPPGMGSVGAPTNAPPTTFLAGAVGPGTTPDQKAAISAPVYGGVYGLSLDAWSQATKALGISTTNYPSAGSAPAGLQQAAASWYAQQQYQKYGDWGDVAAVMAGGQPLSVVAKNPLLSGDPKAQTIQGFANSVVSQVNAALTQIQNELTQPGPEVVVDRQTPNAPADAAAAAKNADPAQYYAHSASYLYGVLNQAIFGAPSIASKSPNGISGPVAPAVSVGS